MDCCVKTGTNLERTVWTFFVKMQNIHQKFSGYILIICCFGLSKASEEMMNKYVFTNASKHWNHYVRKMLHVSLEIYFPKSIHYEYNFDPPLYELLVTESNQYAPLHESITMYLKHLSHRLKLFHFKSRKVESMYISKY